MPHPLLEAMLCEQFHCLPSALDEEDAPRLLQGLEALSLYQALRRLQRGEKLSREEREMVGEVLEWERREG